MEEMARNIYESLGGYLPQLLGALGILIIGWLVALFVSSALRALLKRSTFDKKIAKLITGKEGAKIETEKLIPKVIFYTIMLFVLIAFFQSLGLTIVTEPINRLLSGIFEFAPRILGVSALLLIAWAVATLLRTLLSKALEAANVDEKLGGQAKVKGKEKLPVTKSIVNTVYWLVFLLFLPAVLSTLALDGLLTPVQGMLNSILAMLPNIFAAGMIVLIGWFIAKIVREISVNLLTSIGVDGLSEKTGLSKSMGTKTLSGILGMLIYVLILIPVVISALDTLKIEAISSPARHMLQTTLNFVPSIFAASLILIIAYIVGRLICELVVNLLTGVGFNSILVNLGIGKEVAEGKKTPSDIVASIVLAVIMLFAAMEASSALKFTALSAILSQFMVFVGQIGMGIVILGLGLYIANFVANLITDSGSQQGRVLSISARTAIIILSFAMGLRQMGLANEIVTLAFGLLLGSIAVALALAVGLGSREIAAREVEKLITKIKE